MQAPSTRAVYFNADSVNVRYSRGRLLSRVSRGLFLTGVRRYASRRRVGRTNFSVSCDCESFDTSVLYTMRVLMQKRNSG